MKGGNPQGAKVLKAATNSMSDEHFDKVVSQEEQRQLCLTCKLPDCDPDDKGCGIRIKINALHAKARMAKKLRKQQNEATT